MELLTASSKISRVAAELRTMIKKQGYQKGSRLCGTRQLAEQFDVSPTTVKYALDILQKEKLIRCEHGRGIFVEPKLVDNELEVFFLLWGARREPCNYYEEISKIAYPPILKPGFSFMMRTVFKDSDDFSYFDLELDRIAQMPQISCILASSVNFSCKHFARLESLHCPVVYFADSKYEDSVDYPRNRIVDTADWTVAAIEHFKKNRVNEFTVFIPDSSIIFFRDPVRRLVAAASGAGIKMNLYEISCSLYNEPDRNKVAEYYCRQLEKADAAGHLDCPVLTFGMIRTIFFELPIVRRCMANSIPFIEPQLSSDRMGDFYEAVFSLIRETVTAPHELHRYEICTPVILHDFSSGNNYCYDKYQHGNVNKAR